MSPKGPTETPEQAEERILDEVLDEMMAAHGHLLAPEERELARRFLGDVLATHPVTADLIAQLAPPKQVERSDKIPADGVVDEDDEAAGGTG